MKKLNLKSGGLVIELVFMLSLIFLISYSWGEKTWKVLKPSGGISLKKAAVPSLTGDADLRIGSLGGSLSVTDPTSPIFGSSISFGNKGLITDDREFIRFQIDNAAVIKKDGDGNPRVLEIQPGNETTGVLIGKIALTVIDKTNNVLSIPMNPPDIIVNKDNQNILLLYVDTNGDGKADSFPVYFIKEVKIKTVKLPKIIGQHIAGDEFNPPMDILFNKMSLPEITTFADLPGKGTVLLLQVLEPPDARIRLKTPNAINPTGSGENFTGVGPQVTFDVKNTMLSANDKAITPTAITATISVPYYKDVLTSFGKDATSLQLLKLGSEKSTIISGVTVDKDKGILSAPIDSFGSYQAVVATSAETSTVPEIIFVNVSGKKDKILIQYQLAGGGSTSDVKIEYRKAPGTDPNEGWKEIATVTGVTPDSKKTKSFAWKTSSLLGKVSAYFQVRVTPISNISGTDINGAARVSEAFRIETGKKLISPKGVKALVTNFEDNKVAADGEETNPPQVALNWEPSKGDVSGYNLYRKARFTTGNDTNFKLIKSISGAGSTTYTDSKENGTLTSSFYEALYNLTAFNTSGDESIFSEELRVASTVFGSYYYYGT